MAMVRPLRIASLLICASLVPGLAVAQWPAGFSYSVGTNIAKYGAVDGLCVPGETLGDFYAMICSQGTAIGSRSWQVLHLTTQGASLWPAGAVTLQMADLADPYLGPGFAPRGD